MTILKHFWLLITQTYLFDAKMPGNDVWRCFSAPLENDERVKERWCRIGKDEKGALCRVPVDEDTKNPHCSAKYVSEYKNKKPATSASFLKHLRKSHPGWEEMLEREDANCEARIKRPRLITNCFSTDDTKNEIIKKEVR